MVSPVIDPGDAAATSCTDERIDQAEWASARCKIVELQGHSGVQINSASPLFSTRLRRSHAGLARHVRLIQVPLKPREYFTDHLGLPKIRNSVGNGIVVLEPQQWRQLLLIELLHTHAHVV